jgi:hypothetical protein
MLKPSVGMFAVRHTVTPGPFSDWSLMQWRDSQHSATHSGLGNKELFPNGTKNVVLLVGMAALGRRRIWNSSHGRAQGGCFVDVGVKSDSGLAVLSSCSPVNASTIHTSVPGASL